jgi:hypothetical protein
MFKAKNFAVVVLVAVGFVGLPAGANGQTSVNVGPTSSPMLVWHPDSVHYHRVYQGRYWVWSPGIGWYAEDRYADVPHWIPGYYTYAYSVDPYWVGTQTAAVARR